MDRKEFIRQYRETIVQLRRLARTHVEQSEQYDSMHHLRYAHRERAEHYTGKADGMVEIINHLDSDYVK